MQTLEGDILLKAMLDLIEKDILRYQYMMQLCATQTHEST